MRYLALLIALGFASLNTACSLQSVGSDEVKTEQIQQNYSLTYIESAQRTDASAQFLAESGWGHSVELLYPAVVMVNSTVMNHNEFLGSWYTRSFNGYLSTTTFKYIDSDGKTYENQGTILPVSVKTYSSTVNKNEDYKVDVKADNLRKEDNIVVNLCQDTDAGPTCVRADSKTTTVAIHPKDMKDLIAGPAYLEISREYSGRTTQNTNSIGSVYTSYIASRVYVNIEE